MTNSSPPLPSLFPADKQARLDQLLEINAQGIIAPAEQAELQALVAEAEALAVTNAQQLADFVRGQSVAPPAGAMPVTVWVMPVPTES